MKRIWREKDLTEEALERRQEVHPQRYAFSKGGMASTQHFCATEAAQEILAEGGNAIDAAVAAAFALGVCEPAASGLGGQTMMLIHDAEKRRNIALDGSSRAPNRASPGLLNTEECLGGWCATTVPATPAALEYARKTFGTLPLARLLEPSIRLAEEGYHTTKLQTKLIKRKSKQLREGPAGALFLKNGEKPYTAGSLFRQPVLAETYRRIAQKGVEDFYQGDIAKIIDDDMQKNGGLLRLDDLAQIPWPIERRPISGRFEDKRVLTFPPPGAGRTLIEMLNILSHFSPKYWTPDTPEGALVFAEIIRRAYLDRRDRPFDPNFYPQVDERRMLCMEYGKLVAHQTQKRCFPQKGETTHLSVMDAKGNAVALTQSIERVYGSCVASPELGFLYNNYMSDYEYEDISHPYFLRPNAVPWASVSPTIVFRGSRPWLTIGSPGSERIAPSIVQVLLRLRTMNLADAISAPRIFCTLDGTVHLEASRMRSDIPKALEERGFKVHRRGPFSFYMGCVQAVLRDRDGLVGVADSRRDGSAGGPEG